MNTIHITAAELLPGDISGGDVISHREVGERFTFLWFEGDPTRLRVSSSANYTVEREDGVSTVTPEAAPVQDCESSAQRWFAAEAAAGAERERVLLNELRREHRRFS